MRLLVLSVLLLLVGCDLGVNVTPAMIAKANKCFDRGLGAYMLAGEGVKCYYDEKMEQ